jgi:competence ComEA-like helix-hairpin-helix protein
MKMLKVRRLVMREPIDLDTAGKEELMQLQDVSERSAQTLLEHRTQKGRFESLEDLAEVEGLSDGTIDKIRAQVTIGPGSMADWHRRWLNYRPA